MGRGPRLPSTTGYYHVVTRGNQRQRVFYTADDYLQFCAFLREACVEHGVQCSHFCLMPNHVHLLAHVKELGRLGQAMHQVQRRCWFWVRRQRPLSGHLWQGRFRSFPIEDEAYLLEAARYIERNPLEAKLVRTPAAYPWSSYRFYVTGQNAPMHLVPTSCYLALGKTAAERRHRY